MLVLTLLLTTAHGGVATAIIVSAPGTRTWSGPVLFSAWGLGSLLGGLLLVRLGRGRELPGLVPVMLALTAPTCLLMLPAFALGPAAAAAGLLVLGLPIAPTLTGLYLYAQRLAPAGRENEVYALVQATIIAGFGVGTTLTGALDGTLDGAAAGFVPACLVTLAALALSIPLYVASARTAEPSSP